MKAAGVAESHDFGAFVDCFARGIVYRLSDDLHVVEVFYNDNLRIAARDEQAEEWECGLPSLFVVLDEVGQHVCLQVIDIDRRDAERQSKPLGKRNPDEQ